MLHDNLPSEGATPGETPQTLKAVLMRMGASQDELTPGAVEARRQRQAEASARARAERCPTCQGLGWLIPNVDWEDPRFGQAFPCRCTLARQRQGFLANLPARSLDGYHPGGNRSFQMALDGAREFVAHRGKPWLVLAGDVGTGKTHLALAVIRARAEAEPPEYGQFLPAAELLSWLREGINLPPGSLDPDMETRVRMACRWPLLALDDLGAHYFTPWAEEKLLEILDARNRYERETIVTMNVGIVQFSEPMSSRLRDNRVGWHFVLEGPDYRQLPGR